jgi:DNA-binding transcriptional LysR family regulator
MPINEFRSITIFAKAAELGSLRKAAAAMGMSPQAASQALAQLEKHLDARLFHRTTRVLALTDEGRQFLEEAQPSLAGLERALHIAKRVKEEISGPLRIVGPRATFQPVLWKLLEEFCQRYPGIVPDVQLEDRIGNWVEDRVDVGFRLGVSTHEGVIARRLFAVQMIICASPSYIERNGFPESLATLQSHRCSVYRHPVTGAVVPWRVKTGNDIIEQPVAPAICTNDEILELHAVLAGHVVGQLAGVTAAPFIRSGQLVPLLLQHISERSSYFMYFGSRRAQPARARAFVDLAAERLTDASEYILKTKELKTAHAKVRRS